MKKSFRNIFILAMIAALCLTLALPALAVAEAEEATYSITINNEKSGHNYLAYQIFSGQVVDGELTDIYWGSGITEEGKTALGDAAAKAAALTDETALKAFAQELLASGYLTNPTAQTEGGYAIEGLTSGYYLVKDDESADLTDDAYTSFIVTVVGADQTVKPKSGIPTVDKQVEEMNDTTGETSMGEAADHDTGDYIAFELTAAFQDVTNFADYETYSIAFNDTLSAGLLFEGENAQHSVWSVALKNAGKEDVDITSYFTLEKGTADANSGEAYAGGQTLTFACEDIKAIDGVSASSTIVVSYTARLSEDAVVGADGNPNKVSLTYSNNPNGSGEGTTTEDTVIVFTYTTIVNKVNSQGDSLAGAEFSLLKYKAIAEEGNNWVAVGTMLLGEDGSVAEVSGNLTVSEDGTTFTFTGLDAGQYKLVESKAPAGYNAIEDVEFEIQATYQDPDEGTPALTALSVPDEIGLTFTADTTAGTLTTDVVNQSGASLPETGGVGTTIFYVVGAILVVGAGVVLVARKRVSKAE